MFSFHVENSRKIFLMIIYITYKKEQNLTKMLNLS